MTDHHPHGKLIHAEKQQTSFGDMWSHDLKSRLSGKFEIMHFAKAGKLHRHKEAEVAVCIGGTGIVWIECSPGLVQPIYVKAGEVVRIAPTKLHRMEPQGLATFCFMIAYEVETTDG